MNRRDFAKATAGVAAALLTGEVPPPESSKAVRIADKPLARIAMKPGQIVSMKPGVTYLASWELSAEMFELIEKIEAIQPGLDFLKSEGDRLGHLVAKVNDAPFYLNLFPAGSLMFLGASYQLDPDTGSWTRRILFQRATGPTDPRWPKRADFSPLEPSPPPKT